MLIFTFRLHGLIEVTPCGNIAGAMALNRGARPISSLFLPTRPPIHYSSSCPHHAHFFFFPLFCPHSAVPLSSTFFPRVAFFFSPLAAIMLNSVPLAGCYFAYLLCNPRTGVVSFFLSIPVLKFVFSAIHPIIDVTDDSVISPRKQEDLSRNSAFPEFPIQPTESRKQVREY